jgi:hypothetical protein
MFHSGYINRPTGGAGRFGVQHLASPSSQQQDHSASQTNHLQPNVMTQSINMTDSSYMSTSMYMGNIVTNRFANAGNAPTISKERGGNVMYRSQALGNGATNKIAAQAFKQDMKLFTIPPKVQQYIDNSTNEFKYLEKDVISERVKMNAELDSIQQTILMMIQEKRTELNNVYDDYLRSFQTNIDISKQRIASFKDTTDWVKMQNSENGDRLVRLTDIAYFTKDPASGVYREFRKEPHKNICELRNLKQEVLKHNLEFYIAELERMGIHYPTFANTASSGEYLGEVKERLLSGVKVGMEDFGKLAYSAPFVRFNELLSEPHIFTSLGETRLNCLTNMRDLSNNSFITCKAASLSHEQEITTILNIDDESFATGDKAGCIHVFNHEQAKETHKFKMKGITQITSLGRIRTTYDLVSGGEEMLASQVIGEGEKHDRNIFLISGHAKPDCVISIWDLKKQVFVKQLKGHSDDITAISSLQDGHTLLTGSKSGTTMIFNITKKKPVKTFQNLVNSPVNAIYTFNDLSRFAIGYNNGEVTVCSIQYEVGIHNKMAVCVTADLVTTLKSKSPVLCLNESHTNPNTLITGHEDCLVRIWDIASGKVLKEIKDHKTPVMGIMVIENPFSINLEENYHILSCGENQDDVYFYQPKQNKQFQMKIPTKLDWKGSKGRNPKLQMYRESKEASEQGIHVASFSNTDDGKKQIVFISIK